MQKKLITVAVAGALAVPMLAAAQSTVTMSGRATIEYGYGDQGANRPNVDYADTPGGSNLNIRGTESLGGGMSAWFQCETSMDIRGLDRVGLCSRNSAVGFRGGFGNTFWGRWDTPMKRALNMGSVGSEETGLLGTSFLGFGGSGGSVATMGAETSAAGTDIYGEGQQRQRWKRRETCFWGYDSPNFGGFQVLAGFSCGNAPADNAYTNAMSNTKPRVQSISGTYVNGPLQVGLGYEKHTDMGFVNIPATAPSVGIVGGAVAIIPGTPAAATVDLDDTGYGGGISYGFMGGNLLVGFTWLRREWETGVGAELKKDTWTLGVDWRLAGPHQLQFWYGKAGDSKGNSLVGIGGNGGAAAPGGDTGADQWSIAYQYHFSKRTTIKFGYTRVDNDANANSVRIGNTAALLGTAAGGSLGQNVDAWAFLVKHNF